MKKLATDMRETIFRFEGLSPGFLFTASRLDGSYI